MRRWGVGLAVFVAWVTTVDAMELTLEQAIAIAMDASYGARLQEIDLVRARDDHRATRARFRPQLSLALTAPDLDESTFEVRDTQGTRVARSTTVRWGGNLSLRQSLPTNGELSVVAAANDTRNEPTESPITRTTVSTLSFGISQPLLQPNTRAIELERARLSAEQAERRYSQGQLDRIHEVTEAFYALLRARQSLAIARDDAELQSRSVALARRKFEAGLIPEVEALQLEVDEAQSQNALLTRETAATRAADRFRMVVGLALDTDVELVTPADIVLVEVDADQALAHALEHRTDIIGARVSRRLAELSYQGVRRPFVTGELTLSYGLSGTGENDVFGDRWNESLDDLQNDRRVGLRLEVPLWDAGLQATRGERRGIGAAHRGARRGVPAASGHDRGP